MLSKRQIGKASLITAVFVGIATSAVAQNYKSGSNPLTATNGGNDVAYMYGSFVKENVSGDRYIRNNTYINNPDLDHSVYEETDHFWMNSNGFWIDGETDLSPEYQTAGWHYQYDHALRSSSVYAYGNMETAVKQSLSFRPDPSSAVEVSKNFWF